ncbi:hypothetical protein [Legionella massiliensis]|nr:hypothetical protein [Legionella massiliensis]
MSMIKYYFDIVLQNSESAAIAMQEWISSPLGAALTAISTISFVGFAFLASRLDKDDKNPIKRFIAILWPYIRDALKSLRNALRGVTSTLTLLHLLDIVDIRQLIIPLGLVIGVVSLINRIWSRYRLNQQDKMLNDAKTLLNEIADLKEFDQIEELRRKIIKQTTLSKTLSFLSVLLSALIDGINPYIGALAIAAINPPVLIVITVFCSIYFLSTLITKIYDEINKQHQLTIAQKKVEIALLAKEMDLLEEKLINLEKSDEYYSLRDYLDYLHYEHEQAIAKFSESSPVPLLVQGIKCGLNIYKYIMLTISTFLFLSPIRLPSIPAISRAGIGLTALGGGTVYTLASTSFKKASEESIKTERKRTRNPHLFFSDIEKQSDFACSPMSPVFALS